MMFLVCKLETTYYKSPIGILKIIGNDEGIQVIDYTEENSFEKKAITSSVIIKCILQLDEYFSGTRKEFSLKLNPQGTNFQVKVWQELLNVPYGKTRSYLQQSKTLGDVKAIRAVGTANGRNPLAIIIPCQRIVGSNGSLTGYAGGIWRKKWLLEHEGGYKQQSLF